MPTSASPQFDLLVSSYRALRWLRAGEAPTITVHRARHLGTSIEYRTACVVAEAETLSGRTFSLVRIHPELSPMLWSDRCRHCFREGS